MASSKFDDIALTKALANLAPVLQPDSLVFCSTFHTTGAAELMASARATLIEDEGLSLILPRTEAVAAGLAFDETYRQITLMTRTRGYVFNFVPTIGKALSRAEIHTYFVNGAQHAHVMVPARQADQAVDVLRKLREKAQKRLA